MRLDAQFFEQVERSVLFRITRALTWAVILARLSQNSCPHAT